MTTPASARDFFLEDGQLAEKFAQKRWYHSLELPGESIEGLIALDVLQLRLEKLPIPKDLRGKRVLDIGCWDGFFSFEMERRGADVVAVDAVELETFRYAHHRLGSSVDYREMDVYDLDPARIGTFDIILFLGVLYHLKHPLLALEKVCSVARDQVIVESFTADQAATYDKNGAPSVPYMHFFETNELGKQYDNWCAPSEECLFAMCRTAGFVRVGLLESVIGSRTMLECRRSWPSVPEEPSKAPELLSALNDRVKGFNFVTRRDDYVNSWFRSSQTGLDRENVYLEVGGLAIRPLNVTGMGQGMWQANYRLPPGLPPGWLEVRLRTAVSAFSNPFRIAVDMPAGTTHIAIDGAADAQTFAPNQVQAGGFIAAWVGGLPSHTDLSNINLRINATKLVTDHVAETQDDGLRQVNARLPRYLKPGPAILVAAFYDLLSDPVEIAIVA